MYITNYYHWNDKMTTYNYVTLETSSVEIGEHSNNIILLQSKESSSVITVLIPNRTITIRALPEVLYV